MNKYQLLYIIDNGLAEEAKNETKRKSEKERLRGCLFDCLVFVCVFMRCCLLLLHCVSHACTFTHQMWLCFLTSMVVCLIDV